MAIKPNNDKRPGLPNGQRPYGRTEDLPVAIRRLLPDQEGRELFLRVVNALMATGDKHSDACLLAWGTLRTAGWRLDERTWTYRRF